MTWKIGNIIFEAEQRSEKVLWCEETKCVVLTERQLKALNENFVQSLIEHHNEALKATVKREQERHILMECLNSFK